MNHVRSALVVAALLLAACGGKGRTGSDEAPAAAASVAVGPEAVLLTGAGESKTLTAVVRDAGGNEIHGAVSWASSDPAIVSVDDAGTIRSITAVGSARITASVDALRSEPVYVSVAQPAAGAQLIGDREIVSGPTAVDPGAEAKSDNPYEVVLRGVQGLAAGAILINTEALPVAGRVVSIQPEGNDLRVRLVAVPPGQLFTSFEFKDSVDLSQGPLEVPADLAAAYEVQQTGSSLVFTPKPETAFPSRGLHRQHAATAVGTTALPPLPPFKECKATAGFGSGLPVPLALSAPPSFSLSVNASLQRNLTPLGATILLRGTPSFKFTSVLEIKSAFQASVECKVTLVRRKVHVPGWAGLFFGGDVELGVGFEVGGKVTLVSAKVGGSVEINSTIEAGVACPAVGDCALTGKVTSVTDAKPVLEAPSLNQARFEPTVGLFGFLSLEAGNADIEQLQFQAIEAKAGVELGADLTFEALQIDDTAPTGRSKYALAFKGEVGPGIKFGEFLQFLGLSQVVPLKLSFEAPIGESPTGTVSADRAQYLPGDPVTVQVLLEPASTVFSGLGFYNVGRVAVLRKNGLLSTDVLAEVTANPGQTDFTLTFTSPGLLNASELFAFVVTRLLPLDPPKLEIGAAKAPAAVTAVAAGALHTCALVSDGAVKCWGGNGFGQLGNGSRTDSPIAKSVSGISSATMVTAAAAHSCALLSDGTVKCWGHNLDGQLGNGTDADSLTPVSVSGIHTATALSAGGAHTCALLSGGTVTCWGFNGNLELGQDLHGNSLTPVPVSGISGATAVVSGGSHTCALLSGGALRCWGANFGGILGNETPTQDFATPVPVRGISTAIAMAAGGLHTCAILSGGTVTCWGDNQRGQLGDGTISFSPNPNPSSVGGISTATALTAEFFHTCALLSDGTVKCWGDNQSGQLGNGTTSTSPSPNPSSVIGISTATAVSAGALHTCALLSDGAVKCWGGNGGGELGNGTTTDSTTPVSVIGLP